MISMQMGHASIFGVGFEPVQDGDAVVRTLGVGHTAALAAHVNDVRAAAFRAVVDHGVQSLLDGIVKFLADQAVLNGDRRGIGHGRNKAVFAERGPVLLSDQVEAFAAETGRDAAHVVKRHFGIEVDAHRALLETALARRAGSERQRWLRRRPR
jgi:hypothetical protein